MAHPLARTWSAGLLTFPGIRLVGSFTTNTTKVTTLQSAAIPTTAAAFATLTTLGSAPLESTPATPASTLVAAFVALTTLGSVPLESTLATHVSTLAFPAALASATVATLSTMFANAVLAPVGSALAPTLAAATLTTLTTTETTFVPASV